LLDVAERIASRYRDGVLWSPAYFAASAGGAPLAIIKQYVEQHRSFLLAL
jgi:putative transposase